MTFDDLIAPLAGQGPVQIGELLLAFALASLIGLERQLRSKSAGLRTQAIVGTASALLVLVSKYGFSDVLVPGHVVLDPSRVAAQIVSGVGFLGAGLILTRRGAVRGLTTAAAVWETAAVGMAAGAGLWLLALVVTALHLVIVFGYTAALRSRFLAGEAHILIDIAYEGRRSLLPEILAGVTNSGWSVGNLTRQSGSDASVTSVRMELAGRSDPSHLLARVAGIDGVVSVDRTVDDELE